MPREPSVPAWLLRINEQIVNPVQRLWAPWLPPWALILHTGRRSGTPRRTPVLAFGGGDGTLCVVLFYGSRTQWIRNVEAGGGWVVRAGRQRRIAGTRIVDDAASLRGVAALAARRGLPVLVIELGQRG